MLGAASLLAAEASRGGVAIADLGDPGLADLLAAYGGEALAEMALRLLGDGFRAADDDGASVVVVGTGLRREVEPVAEARQFLGYPGAKWSAAYSGNYQNASRGAAQINYVVIHTTQGSYSGTISWFKNPSANVSAHYVVRSSDGEVTQMVDDSDIAWHDGCFNTNSIGIEHEGFVQDPGKWYTDKMYVASAKLTAWLCDKYGIPKDRKHIMGHGETPDCSSHTDPGGGWRWDHYMSLVKSGGSDPDRDADGIKNEGDNCPDKKNPGQLDTDKDGKGDASDGDDDADQVPDAKDNCPKHKNPGQLDADGDGKGDACEKDDDGDGLVGADDNCPAEANPDQPDADDDGKGDACDEDDDGDGVPDAEDVCPDAADPTQLDSDEDGEGDACEASKDGGLVLEGEQGHCQGPGCEADEPLSADAGEAGGCSASGRRPGSGAALLALLGAGLLRRRRAPRR